MRPPPAEEHVYQASPADCVKVAREYLRKALEHLDSDDPSAAYENVRHALSWLPSWAEKEWDETMAAWIARANEREATP